MIPNNKSSVIYQAPISKWKALKNRRLQNWGGVVHKKGLLAQDLPPWLRRITNKVFEESCLFPSAINHVLINEYLPNQGIMPHQDGPAYFPVVAIVSLGSPVVMDFTPHSSLQLANTSIKSGDGDDDQWLDGHHPFSVLLMPGSLLVFKDKAYSDYLHGIKDTEWQQYNQAVNVVEDLKHGGLVSLNFSCLKGAVQLPALERLVARCPNLRSLRLNHSVPVDALQRILAAAPQLVDLGTGAFVHDPDSDTYHKLEGTIRKCKSIRCLSGFLEVAPHSLRAIYSVCANLTSLNLSYAPDIHGFELIKLIRHCRKLQRLWILDCIGDKGLDVVASTCKELQELRVFPSDVAAGHAYVTEEGLVAISFGCPKLHSLLYFCHQMTNAALITVAKNCPNFTRFRLCILDPTKPDAVTNQPLDEGFGAIVQSCKGLRRLSMSGHLTDQVFLYIGMYAEQLEMLSVAFAGNSDNGMLYVLNGCKKLKKLEVRDSPFGDGALLRDVSKYETMRSLWMSSCQVTVGGCRTVAETMRRLNVEIINEGEQLEASPDDDRQKVEKMYLYRTLAGPRRDAPGYVWTL